MIEHRDGYCTKCLMYREERFYERHFLLVPVPKKKKCDYCYEQKDRIIDKINRAAVAEATSKRKADPRVNPGFVAKRRKHAEMQELKAIEKEFEL